MSTVLWTVTKDQENATQKTTNDPAVYLVEKEYSADEYAIIRAEADEWNVKEVSEDGYDYGYGNSEYNRYVFFKEISDEILVVEDGHFCGIMMRSTGSAFNKFTTIYDDLFIAFTHKYIDGKAVMCAREGESFSSDDHSTWDTTSYYLCKKEDKEKERVAKQ